VVVDDGSLDPDAMADVVGRRGGRLVRRAHSGGPAAARNTGLAEVETDLVAFLDSDCTATEDWLRLLLGHFDDPVVAAVAPRVHPRRVRPAGALQRYLEGRSPIDLGPDEGPVVPGGHVSFVPTAALVVRRSALRAGFDEQLRFGEDVDLVWRLHEAGWRVRYDPTVTVLHDEPQGLRRVLSRRFRYGTSAAPLARRHPGRLTPAILHRWPTVLVVVASGGRPRSAAILALPYCAMLTRRAHRLGLSPAEGPRWFAESLVYTALSLARYLATFGTPVTLAAAWRWRRPSLLGLIALPAFVEWRERETELDPVRFTALALVDDAAYGAGVAWGCLRHRTLQPLLPRLR
jgi:mycofactocin system glycosyltransferase